MQDDTLQVLLDKQAISEKLHQYCRAMDRVDDALGRSVFHEDADVDYGEIFRGTGYGFVDFVHDAHLGMQVHQHMLGNILITVDGDSAGSESYVTATFRIQQADGSLMGLRSHGRYIDRWQRRAGEWRIAHRAYLHDMDEMWPTAMQYESQGLRDRTDPSYEVLGTLG